MVVLEIEMKIGFFAEGGPFWLAQRNRTGNRTGGLPMENETTETMNTNQKPFHLRGFFSLLLFCSFTLLLISGIILYITPKGRVAHWTGWTLLGLGKEDWSAIHITLTLLVLIASGFHLYYNWGIFWGYITRKAQSSLNLKREMVLAILLCGITVAGTLYNVPPFGTIIKWNDDIKDYWEARAEAPPMPHAEILTIEQLAFEIGMPLEEVLERLSEAGVAVDDPSITVERLAIAHGMTPSGLFALIQPQPRGMGGGDGTGRGMGGGGGAGRGMGGGGGRSQSTD